MLPKVLIERRARKQASSLFFENHFQQQSLQTKEEVQQLAQQEAEHFYQSGTILWFFKVCQLATHQAVSASYVPSFTDQYELHTANTTEPYDPLKGLPEEYK